MIYKILKSVLKCFVGKEIKNAFSVEKQILSQAIETQSPLTKYLDCKQKILYSLIYFKDL